MKQGEQKTLSLIHILRKYILQLEERELIVTRSSGRRNGNLLFTPARFRR